MNNEECNEYLYFQQNFLSIDNEHLNSIDLEDKIIQCIKVHFAM